MIALLARAVPQLAIQGDPSAKFAPLKMIWLGSLFKLASAKSKNLPEVLLLLDFATKPDKKAAYQIISNSIDFGRPIANTPCTPLDRLAVLRAAFDRTMEDPGFIAEVKKQRSQVGLASEAEIERVVHELIEMPENVRNKVKAAISARP